MSVYTTVTPDELTAWLHGYEVGALLDFRGIAAGIENTNYFVTTSTGRYVLTLFEKLTAVELPFYLGLMAHLARRGVPSACPVADRAGRYLGELNGKPAALVDFLRGSDISHPDPAHCAAVGAMLANIHLAGASYPAHMENPRGLLWWQSVTPELLPFLSAKDAVLLGEEVEHQSAQDVNELPRGAIHADLIRDNVLFEDGRISGVIDFYFACTDTLLYDVAIAVIDWCVRRDGSLDPERTRSLVGAYSAVRPFTPCEPPLWPAMLRAGALRFWVSRLYDYHLPREGELTHAKDPAHFRKILRRHVEQAPALEQLAPTG
jgi:homoserine kinase type II